MVADQPAGGSGSLYRGTGELLRAAGQAPKIGKPYSRHPSVQRLRRVLLRATRYHVYYVPRADAVAVLAVWHSQRGQLPPL